MPGRQLLGTMHSQSPGARHSSFQKKCRGVRLQRRSLPNFDRLLVVLWRKATSDFLPRRLSAIPTCSCHWLVRKQPTWCSLGLSSAKSHCPNATLPSGSGSTLWWSSLGSTFVLPGWISKHTIFYQRLLLGNMRNLLFVFSFLQYYRWFYRSKANGRLVKTMSPRHVHAPLLWFRAGGRYYRMGWR